VEADVGELGGVLRVAHHQQAASEVTDPGQIDDQVRPVIDRRRRLV
jgi:hypothetical protein